MTPRLLAIPTRWIAVTFLRERELCEIQTERERSTLSSSILANRHVVCKFRVLETSRWSHLVLIWLISLGFGHTWFESWPCYLEV